MRLIETRGLSKAYRIGHRADAGFDSLRDVAAAAIKHPFGIGSKRVEFEQLWAIRDIDLNVEQGEILGLIGRNGSGKSTLLKILSRITAPTRGEAILRGHVASLLEVGTGFHPDLTGRENVFLNGAILGMARQEIASKFDDIVEFAGIERFLDTPVKFYSSGMYVRLAFAVAAHLEPDILLVDEVLSVGDAEFQRRSLGKMREVTQEQGRTVVFVSHNMTAIQSLCSRVIMLDAGKVEFEGPPLDAIRTYLKGNTGPVVSLEKRRVRTTKLFFTRIELVDGAGRPRSEFLWNEEIGVRLHFDVSETQRDVQIVIEIWNDEGVCLLASSNLDEDPSRREQVYEPGHWVASCTLTNDFMREGTHYIAIGVSNPGVAMFDEIENAATFDIIAQPEDIRRLGIGRRGVTYRRFHWDVGLTERVGEEVLG